MGIFSSLKKKASSVERIERILSDDLVTPEQIADHLKELCAHNVYCNVKVDDRPMVYTSVFVKFVEGHPGSVLIDTLVPKVGNRHIYNSSLLELSYNYENGYVCITHFIEEVTDRFPLFRLAAPEVIKTIQRRSSYRVNLSIDSLISVNMGDGVKENILDISEGGLAFLTAKNKSVFSPGVVLKEITITFPEHDRVIVAVATVRWFAENVAPLGRNKNKCCIQFMDMKMNETDFLAKFVFEKEREIIRRTNRELE